ARQQYTLVGVIRRLLVANGVRTDLEIAQFDADHGVSLGRALVAARQARRALRLGTHDALKYFHRGMIERCLGHESRSWFVKAVRLNPHFSLLWSPLARRYAT